MALLIEICTYKHSVYPMKLKLDPMCYFMLQSKFIMHIKTVGLLISGAINSLTEHTN